MDVDIDKVQADVTKLRFPNASAQVDEKSLSSIRGELSRLIKLEDDFLKKNSNANYKRFTENQRPMEEINVNTHRNRDLLKTQR